MDKKELLKEEVEKSEEFETEEETKAKIRDFLYLHDELISDFLLFPKMSKSSLKERWIGLMAVKRDMENPRYKMHYDGDENLKARAEYLVKLYSKYTKDEVLHIFDMYNKYGVA